MGNVQISGGSKELNYSFKLDIAEGIKQSEKMMAKLKELNALAIMGGKPAADNFFRVSQINLQDALRKSRLELTELKKKEQELLNQQLATGAATAELTRKIAENRLAQQELTKANKAAREAAKATAGSYKEAQDRLKALGLEIKNTTGGFNAQTPALQAKISEYKLLNERLKAFDETMGNHQRKVADYPKGLGVATAELKAMALSYVSATAILAGVSRIVSNNAEISDSMADVQRTTGLAAQEVEALTESLKKIDTRTSLKGLLEIAAIGGQLNIAKDQLAGFTKAVDQLAVSLGSELQGGAEGIAKSLGVLDNVFKITASNGGDVEKSFNQIGSAILGLGQSGLATGDYLADFGERVGGVAKQAGLSLPTVLAYGAVLQENGVSAEVAGTSFKKLISALSTNAKGFLSIAKLADANLTLRSFTDLINNDTKSALDKFFAGLQKGGDTTTEFMGILKNLKLSQSGISQSIAALSAGQQSLNGHIKDATTDFENATLSAEQYAIKNDNLAGSIDKLQNAFDNVTTDPNSGIGKALKSISDLITDVIRDLGNAESKLRKFLSFTATGLIYRGANAISNAGKVGGYINGTPVGPDEYKKYQASLAEEAGRQKAVASAKAVKLVNASESDVDLLRKIANEEFKLNVIRGNVTAQNKELQLRKTVITELGEKEQFYTSAKDKERDLAAKNFKEAEAGLKTTSKNLVQQRALVEELKKSYDKLYPKADAPKVAGLPGETAAEQKKREAAAKRIADAAKRAREKELKEQETFYSSMSEIETNAYGGTLSAREKEEYDLNKKFVDRLQREKNTAADIERIKAAHNVALADLQDKFDNEDKEKKDKSDKEEKKTYTDLLASLKNYEEKRITLVADYNKTRAKLVADNKFNEAAVLDEVHNATLASLDDENTKKLDAYKALYADVENLSKAAVEKIASDGKAMLDKLVASGKISKELAKEIAEQLKKTTSGLELRLPKDLMQLGGELHNLSGVVGEIDEGFGKWLGSLADVVSGIGDVGVKIKAINALPKGDIFGQLSGAFGVFGSVFSIGKSLTALFDDSAKREEASNAAREEQSKQLGIMNKLLERQIALIDDAYGTDKILKYSSALKQAGKDEKSYLSQLQGQSYLPAGSRSRRDILLNEDINYYQDLIDKGVLSAQLEEVVKSLITAKQAVIDLGNSLKAELTGTNFEAFADSIIEALGRGEDAAKNFEEAIRSAMLNSLKSAEFKAELQAWYNMFAEFSKDGLTADEIKNLNSSYDALIAKQKQRQSDLEKAAGIKLAPDIEIEDKFLKDLGDKFLKALETSDLAKRVEDYNKRLGAATIKGLLPADIDSFKKEYDDLAKIAIQKQDEFFKLTGKKIEIDPLTLTFVVDADTTEFDNIVANIKDRLAQLALDSQDIFKDVGTSFTEQLKNNFLSSLEGSQYQKAVAAYQKRFNELAAIGFTSAGVSSLKAEYDALAVLAQQKIKEYEDRVGQKISVEIAPPDKSIDEGAKAIGDKLFDVITKSAEETGKSIEEILRQSILEGLQEELVTNALKPLADRIKALYANGKIPTKDEIAQATAEMNTFISNAKLQLEKLEETTGLVFGEKASDALSSAAQKIKDEVQSLSDSIIDTLSNTDGALADFETKWDKMVQNTILKRLQATTLEGRLTEFYNEFKKLDGVEDNKKAEQLALLRAQYNKIIKDGMAEYDRLQSVFGVNYTTPVVQDQGAISSSIGRSITEDTANVLSGTFIGIYDEVKRSSGWLGKIYASATQNLELATKIEANTRRGADNTDGIKDTLNTIERNTRPKTGGSLTDNYLKL